MCTYPVNTNWTLIFIFLYSENTNWGLYYIGGIAKVSVFHYATKLQNGDGHKFGLSVPSIIIFVYAESTNRVVKNDSIVEISAFYIPATWS